MSPGVAPPIPDPSLERLARVQTGHPVARLWTTMWGQANALLAPRRRAVWADLLILAA